MESKLFPLRLLLRIIFLVVASWFLVHLLAIFGVFLVAAYPIWWLFAPQYAICFSCRSKNDGAYCPFCRQDIAKAKGIYPKNLISSLLNSAVLLVFTITSLGLVLGESKLLRVAGLLSPEKTVSFVIPPKRQYKLGEVFPVEIEISGIRTPINTVQADLSFDPARLELINITTEDSFATVFIQKEINNTAGYARLTGGIPSPGFSAEKGVFAKAFFKAKAPGIANIHFLPSSLVLANDGEGTNVIKDLPTFSYLILPEKLSQEEQELQPDVNTSPSVLSASSKRTQIILYDENPSDNVLGAATEKDIEQKKKLPGSIHFFTILGQVDASIINVWRKAWPFR